KPRTAAIVGVRTAPIRSQTANRFSFVSVTGVWVASSLMSAPAAKARVPAPVRTIARHASSASRRSSSAASWSRRSKLSAFSASGRSIVTSATPSTGPEAPAAGNAEVTCNRWGLDGAWAGAASVNGSSVVLTVSMPGEPPGGASATQQVGRVVDDEERREARRDLAQDPAGGPHRVRGEAGVERGAVVEVHRGDEREVGLAAERAGHALDAGPARAGRLGDERQVLRRVAALELGQRVRAAIGPAVEHEQRRHRVLLSIGRVRACGHGRPRRARSPGSRGPSPAGPEPPPPPRSPGRSP